MKKKNAESALFTIYDLFHFFSEKNMTEGKIFRDQRSCYSRQISPLNMMGRMSSESGMGRMGSMSSMENVHVESIWLRSFSPPWPYLVSHCGTNLTLNPILRLLWLIQVITYYISYIIYYTYTLSKSSNIIFASSNLLQLCIRIRKRT